MNYKKIMQKILAELSMYKSEIDKFAADYQAERRKFDEEMEAAEGKFTESYIAETRANWKPSKNYFGLVKMARETHSKTVMGCISQLEQQLNDYFRAPADANFCATLNSIKLLGVTPDNLELKLLQETSGGYWGRKLLNHLAISRTKTEQAAELKGGEMTRTEKEIKIPYGGIDLPDIEKAYDALQSVKNAVNTAFRGYAGANFELKDIVFPLDKTAEETSRKLAETYGVQPRQKQTLGVMETTKMATSINCFSENYRPYSELIKVMDDIDATIPKPPKKTELTEDDRKLIDLMIEPQYPSLAAGKAVEIAKKDERLSELLKLDSRYGQKVREALGEEASGNE